MSEIEENKRLITDKDEWRIFDDVMRAAAKEYGIKKWDYNDFCLMLSENSEFWQTISGIKVAQDIKTRQQTAKEIFEEIERYQYLGEYVMSPNRLVALKSRYLPTQETARK